MQPATKIYHADSSLKGKVIRRWARLRHQRPLPLAPQRPMISFSFDDAPLSAATTGAEILESRGLRGTYYVSAGLAGAEAPMGVCARADDYLRLSELGHEIACHTYSHLDCGRASSEDAARDVARNLAAFADWGLPAPESFAYPYGDVSTGPKAAISHRFSNLRGLHHGLIDQGCDMNQAPAVGIEGPQGEAAAWRWLAQAEAKRSWLILYTHDVRPNPSPWGCTPHTFAALIDAAIGAEFEILTVGDAARRLGL
ncbi:MAG TPA: polysaccharide deacetylase family protein [Phenylobacterium sp.]|nr:polysaccharide deacetylase family protein [Phenylobacterium sp.]